MAGPSSLIDVHFGDRRSAAPPGHKKNTWRNGHPPSSVDMLFDRTDLCDMQGGTPL